jgi:hypothetical protein
MTSIVRIEASATTRAAIGITHYEIDATSGWKAFGAKDEEIASLVVSNEADKGELKLHAHGKRVKIDYSIQRANNEVSIDAVINDVSSKISFAKGGRLISDGFKKIMEPAIREMFHAMTSDLSSLKGALKAKRSHKPSAGIPIPLDDAYCGGLEDAAKAALKAGEWLAADILSWKLIIYC